MILAQLSTLLHNRWPRSAHAAVQVRPAVEARLTDQELIAAARLGDPRAWRELYTRWMPWVWRYAYSLVHDVHAAEDVTSEAMIAWVRNLEKTGQDAPQVAAWLRSVVRHKSVDHHRRGARYQKAVEGVAHVSRREAGDDPVQQALRCETRGEVSQAMGRLKESHRLPLEWKYAEGMSVRQIAERLGTTEKAVEATLYRARREFRRQYEALQPDEPQITPAADHTQARQVR